MSWCHVGTRPSATTMLTALWSECWFIILCNTDTILQPLTHWGRVTHIWVSELTIIGSDNGLSPSRRQAIIWNNAGILLIRPSGTNFSEISIEIDVFSFKKMHLKMSSAKCRPFCLGLNVLKRQCPREVGQPIGLHAMVRFVLSQWQNFMDFMHCWASVWRSSLISGFITHRPV